MFATDNPLVRAESPRAYQGLQDFEAPTLYAEIYGELSPRDPEQAVGIGFLGYLLKHGMTADMVAGEYLADVKDTIAQYTDLMAGKPLYNGRNFRYFVEPETTVETLLTQPLDNARYWTELLGAGFFAQREDSRRQRNTMAVANLDEGLQLRVKGGSGSGTFSADLSIALDLGRKASGEMWRLGVDTRNDRQTDGLAARIVRTGSAAKQKADLYEEKTAAFETFKKRYGVSVQRGLAFLALFYMHDLPGVNRLQAISSQGVSDHRITHALSSSKVRYDYTRHFMDCGFELPTENADWLIMPNDPDGFYEAIATDRHKQAGLRHQEVDGLSELVEAFRGLRLVREDRPFDQPIADNHSSDEVSASIAAHAQISGKRRRELTLA